MKTKCGLDAIIKYTDDKHHHGIIKGISGEAFAKWDKVTGKHDDGDDFDLVIEQKPKYELPEPTSRHYKFAKYCQSIGYPDIELAFTPKNWMSFKFHDYKWRDDCDCRIANDSHHELRREWIDSDFILQVAHSNDGINWLIDYPIWTAKHYRKAEQKPLWHDYIEDDYQVAVEHPDHIGKLRLQSCSPISDYAARATPITTPDGKHLIGFKDGYAHVLPVERGGEEFKPKIIGELQFEYNIREKSQQLGINPEMDKLAHENGLGHWSCVFPKTKSGWLRSDGEGLTIDTSLLSDDIVIQSLKEFDKQYPLKG